MFKKLSNKLVLASLFAGILFSCGDKGTDYVYYRNPPELRTSEKSYPIKNLLRDAKVDILWVVDNSGSMSSIQRNIAQNSSLFMTEFLSANFLNWKIGVVSTDRDEDPYLGFINSFGRGTERDVGSYVTKFSKTITDLGTSGDASEYVFYNAERAIVNYPSFVRPNGHLIIIMVTDEEEQTEEKYGSQYEPDTFINTLKGLMKGREGLLRFYGALSLNDLKDCRDSYSAGDYKGSPYESVITTTGGFHISACGQNWGKQLANIGKDIVTLVKTPKVLLEDKPKIHTIKVLFDGKELATGREEDGGKWYYDDYFNTINFYSVDDISGDPDAKVTITFDIDDGIYRGEE